MRIIGYLYGLPALLMTLADALGCVALEPRLPCTVPTCGRSSMAEELVHLWIEAPRLVLSLQATEQPSIREEVGPFWADYARHLLLDAPPANSTGGFLSAQTHTAAISFTSAVLAFAVLAPTLAPSNSASPDHHRSIRGTEMELTLASPAVVFLEEIRARPPSDVPVDTSALSGKLLLIDAGSGEDKPLVSGPAVCGRPYNWRVVVSNSSNKSLAIEVVAPAPPSAVSLRGSLPLNVMEGECGAYSCTMMESHFYFPGPGAVTLPRVTLVAEAVSYTHLTLPTTPYV